MRNAGLTVAEINFRMRLLKNVSTGKTYFPDPDNALPETRNPKLLAAKKYQVARTYP